VGVHAPPWQADRHAQQILEDLPPAPNDFVSTVRRVVSQELKGGDDEP